VLVAGVFGALATTLMLLFVLAGGHMTLVGAVELLAAGVWLFHLVRTRAVGRT
jgi:hypothetical protein